MAYLKIFPIKVTDKKALDYITNPDKTDEKLLVSSFGCSPETASWEGRSCTVFLLFFRSRKPTDTSFSKIPARVAGVPRPFRSASRGRGHTRLVRRERCYRRRTGSADVCGRIQPGGQAGFHGCSNNSQSDDLEYFCVYLKKKVYKPQNF